MEMASDIEIRGWLTTDQAAETLGLKPDTLRRYANRGVVRAGRRIGNYLLFATSEVERYRREKREAGNPNFRKG
jgi:excisionase family DNA binding protein